MKTSLKEEDQAPNSRHAWVAEVRTALPKLLRLLGFHFAVILIAGIGCVSVLIVEAGRLGIGVALFLICLGFGGVLFWHVHQWHRWLALGAIAVPGWFWVRAILPH